MNNEYGWTTVFGDVTNVYGWTIISGIRQTNIAKIVSIITFFLQTSAKYLQIWVWSGAKVCKSCTSRKMLPNAYLVAEFGFDTAENELSEICVIGRWDKYQPRLKLVLHKKLVQNTDVRSQSGYSIDGHSDEQDEGTQRGSFLHLVWALRRHDKIKNYWRTNVERSQRTDIS